MINTHTHIFIYKTLKSKNHMAIILTLEMIAVFYQDEGLSTVTM